METELTSSRDSCDSCLLLPGQLLGQLLQAQLAQPWNLQGDTAPFKTEAQSPTQLPEASLKELGSCGAPKPYTRRFALRFQLNFRRLRRTQQWPFPAKRRAATPSSSSSSMGSARSPLPLSSSFFLSFVQAMEKGRIPISGRHCPARVGPVCYFKPSLFRCTGKIWAFSIALY